MKRKFIFVAKFNFCDIKAEGRKLSAQGTGTGRKLGYRSGNGCLVTNWAVVVSFC